MAIEPLPGPVKCLGAGCDRTFQSVDKRTNRICPVCTRRQLRKQPGDFDVAVQPHSIYVKGRRFTPRDD